MFNVENGRPPTLVEIANTATVQTKFSSGGSLKLASYCVADNQYAIGVQSKNDQKYYSLNGGAVTNNNSLSIANVCDGLGITKSGGVAADNTILQNNGALTLSTSCATEGQTCSFTGTRVIAFGANGNFFYKTATTSIACTNVAFGGDPATGSVKACYLTN
jgi:hypothetical protein